MDPGLLIAASHAGGHGPQMHGPLVPILVAIALGGAGLVFLLRWVKGRKGSEHDSVRDRDREA
jgi:hypothetical protein